MMRVRAGRWCGWVLLPVLAALMGPAVLSAQQSVDILIEGAPQLVTVALELPEGERFQATAWEGDALVFRWSEVGTHVALVPRVEDRFLGEVRVDVFDLVQKDAQVRIVDTPTRLDVRVGERAYAGSLIDLEVVEVRQPTTAELREYTNRAANRVDLERKTLILPQAGCCVTCGGKTFCGCKVIGACGDCCDGCCGELAK